MLQVDKQIADSWSNREICTRWSELFTDNDLIKRYLKEVKPIPRQNNASTTNQIAPPRITSDKPGYME
ncbi:MAG: hypothetical protein GY820_28925 [Gammaproteobacteria bacterium]|nr:hypothetical protein [Gammaproteobacteria bacterium]